MEKERLAKEAEEREKAEKENKIKEQFGDANSQWEKDKSDLQNMAQQASAEQKLPSRKNSKPKSEDESSADSRKETSPKSKKGVADAKKKNDPAKADP